MLEIPQILLYKPYKLMYHQSHKCNSNVYGGGGNKKEA